MSTIAQNAKTIFLEAVEKHTPGDWPSFLDRACGDDRELRQRVEGLLQAHQDKDSLFDRADPTADYEPLEQTGQMIGPYKLRERLGVGGMGVVWAAEQKKPLRRKVALKVIKPGMDSEQVIARFEAEREALALMDHPNIARVLDAGTTEQGRPYFVMELIRGVPITEYCNVKRLTVHERLDLFVSVCKAVQHAHQKGVIHRDIKPNNVLVSEQDGEPIPKVIDFGVAKALHHPLNDRSVYTGVFQAIGTLAYMSPEQAGLSISDVDTRADVYGLGVLLYELLTGSTPFEQDELASAALDEACRIIREKDPPRPSTKISTLGDRALAISEERGTDPKGLGKLMRGDLDWVVIKSLEKDRGRRYESASGLAADIDRFLSGEAIEARPPSLGYQLSRFVSRHRAVIGTAAAIFVLLFAGAAIATWQAYEKSLIVKDRDSKIEALHEEIRKSNSLSEQLVREKREMVYLIAMSGDAGLTRDAIKDFRASVPPESISVGWEEFVHGIREFEAGDFSEARQHFQTSLDIDESIAATAMLAHCQAMLGEYSAFSDLVFSLKDSSPATPEDFLFLARLTHWTANFDEAQKLLDQYSRRFTEGRSASILERKVRLMVGLSVALRQRNADEASKIANEFEQLRKLIPYDARSRSATISGHKIAYSLLNRAGQAARAQSHFKALKKIETELAAFEGDYRSFGELASFFEEIGDVSAATGLWSQAKPGMLKNNDNIEYIFFLLRRHDYETAERMSQGNDPSIGLLHVMALLGREGGNTDAKNYLQEHAGKIPRHPVFHIMYVAALNLCGEIEDARKLAKSSMSQLSHAVHGSDSAALMRILRYLAQADVDPQDLFSEIPEDQKANAQIYAAVRMFAEGERGDAVTYLKEAHELSGAYFEHTLSWTLLELLSGDKDWPAQ